MNQAPAPNSTADGILTRLPLDRLHESPFNPRRTFTAIEELAADIKAQGVIQPIVVRPIVPPLFDAGRDTEPAAVAGHEIVCGHRRFRASQLAGVPEPLVQMAELHGIDVDAVRAGPVQASAPGDEPSTPPSAGAGADMGAGGMAAAGAGTGNAATANAEEDQDQMDEAGFAGDEAGRGRIAWPEPRKATA